MTDKPTRQDWEKLAAREAKVTLSPFAPLATAARQAVERAADRFRTFARPLAEARTGRGGARKRARGAGN